MYIWQRVRKSPASCHWHAATRTPAGPTPRTLRKTRFARFSVQGRIVRLQYQYAEKPHESYIMRLNLCVKAASYYKQTLAMEDYNNGL